MVGIAPYGLAVPAKVRAAADAVKQSIIDGSFHPFQGPINDQAGEQIVAKGERLDDGVLLGMDYYVEGVQGELAR